MALQSGTKLGHYEIRELIGAGGMGEVYRAHDTQLKRDVALKVLPEQFSRDSDRLARFRREAELLASLNHPNIASIYGIYSEANRNCLVMELVPGDTLHERVRQQGPVPLQESLDIAKQICDALEHAHEKTVIHRDLKPANVKLTSEGTVKVLDFGLAKAFAGDGTSGERPRAYLDSNSPTLSHLPTGYQPPDLSPTLPGVILGTAAYMSPEQAKGKTVDRRTDIWALGCVLYELLTGKQVFTGESATEILGAIHHKEPDWSLLPADTPPGIRALLRRCLQKDARNRLRDAADIKIQIHDSLNAPPVQVSASSPANNLRERIAWAVAAVFFVATIFLSYSRFQPNSTSEANIIRFSIPLPPDMNVAGGQIAVSPDGTRIAFAASNPAGQFVLWVRPLDSAEAQPLSGTEEADGPFWSPDSRSIGFFANGGLKKVAASGGPVQTLANTAVSRGAAWSRNGAILFSPTNTAGLYRVAETGGVPSAVTTVIVENGELNHRWPQFLPDGDHFLYLISNAQSENSGIYVGSLNSEESRRLINTRWRAAYSPPGYLLFVQDPILMAQPFDVAGLELTGEPVLVAESVSAGASNTGDAAFSVSDQGVLAYGSGLGGQELVWFDRQGRRLGTVGRPAQYFSGPKLSPDGTRVAVDMTSPQGSLDIWLLEVNRDVSTRFTSNPATERFPLWSPDGSQIVFHSNRDTGIYDLYEKSSNGSGSETLLFQSGDRKYPRDWSRDGRFLVYTTFGTEPDATNDLWVLPLSGEREAFPYLQTGSTDSQGQFSPDGRWMAYVSDDSGTLQVYISSFPNPTNKVQVSTDTGVQPRWRGDGKELYFLSQDRRLMAAEIVTEPSLRVGTSRVLFSIPFPPEGTTRNPASLHLYDVAADGQRFLMMVPPENASIPITVVLNWTASLKK
jgi:serine/threonine protein kinase